MPTLYHPDGMFGTYRWRIYALTRPLGRGLEQPKEVEEYWAKEREKERARKRPLAPRFRRLK